jgi:hypothetical protein
LPQSISINFLKFPIISFTINWRLSHWRIALVTDTEKMLLTTIGSAVWAFSRISIRKDNCS